MDAMATALAEAAGRGAAAGEVPVGAALVAPDGRLLATRPQPDRGADATLPRTPRCW